MRAEIDPIIHTIQSGDGPGGVAPPRQFIKGFCAILWTILGRRKGRGVFQVYASMFCPPPHHHQPPTTEPCPRAFCSLATLAMSPSLEQLNELISIISRQVTVAARAK